MQSIPKQSYSEATSASISLSSTPNTPTSISTSNMSSTTTTPIPSSPSGSISPTCTGQWRRPPTTLKMGGNPKPVAPNPDLSEWAALLPGILNDAKNFSNGEILANLARASNLMMNSTGADYWISDDGQAELLRRIQLESKPTSTTAPRSWGRSGTSAAGLSPLDYSQASKAMIEKGGWHACPPAQTV